MSAGTSGDAGNAGTSGAAASAGTSGGSGSAGATAGTSGAAGSDGGLTSIAEAFHEFRLEAPCIDPDHFGSGKQNSTPDGHGVSNRDGVVIEGVAPDPEPFNGQFVQFDVVEVTARN